MARLIEGNGVLNPEEVLRYVENVRYILKDIESRNKKNTLTSSTFLAGLTTITSRSNRLKGDIMRRA